MTTETDDETRDDMIFKARLLGGSARAVAERFNIRIGAVEAIVENKMLRLDVGYRARTASLDAERLEALLFRYMRSALAGDTDATYLVLRLLERRSALLGLDCPMKIDPVQINVAPQ